MEIRRQFSLERAIEDLTTSIGNGVVPTKKRRFTRGETQEILIKSDGFIDGFQIHTNNTDSGIVEVWLDRAPLTS